MDLSDLAVPVGTSIRVKLRDLEQIIPDHRGQSYEGKSRGILGSFDDLVLGIDPSEPIFVDGQEREGVILSIHLWMIEDVERLDVA